MKFVKWKNATYCKWRRSSSYRLFARKEQRGRMVNSKISNRKYALRCMFTHVLSAWRNSIEKQNGRRRYELKFGYVFYPLRKLVLTLVSILGNHALHKSLKPLDNAWPCDILTKYIAVEKHITRMHSSRMRTVRNSSRLLGVGGTWSWGVYLVPGGCTWSRRGVPAQGVYLPGGTCPGV